MEIRGGDDLGEKLTSFDFDSGKHLADLLLKEVLEKLPHGVPVRVVPDDSLSVLPFEMLVLAPGAVLRDRRIPCVSGAQFFGDRNPISYCQSVTALTLARTHGSRRDPRGKILILADPVFQASDDRIQGTSHRQAKQSKPHGAMYRELMEAVQDRRFGALAFHRLPLTGRLAHDLQTLYAGDSTALTGLEATKERFLSEISPTLPQYDNVVFATHGYFGNDLPGIMEPVLVFGLVPPGTDGYLRMSEAMGLRMAADIVVLTACQTGLGRRIAGEGTMGMGRAFQYAGARSVLMSLWSVSEEPSVRLVECFFRRLKTGKGKLDALQLARSEIRNAGFDHPFFWAPFILIGEVN
jgi:CHAT domain-containing protein